jgi:F420-dependent oxidoreductase-like protein
MHLGLGNGTWARPPEGEGERILEAERLGYEVYFTSESWGSDSFTPLAWWGAQTSRIKLGTAVTQLSARSPAATGMHALTLDQLCNGRLILGLGVSGPKLVEGWYGQPFAKPLARTREYVDILRQIFARESAVESSGPYYALPYHGPNGLGLGEPLKPNIYPYRSEMPIWLGAEGPKNVALAAEIADGWLPVFFSPTVASTYHSWLKEGFARRGGRPGSGFQIAATCNVVVTDDIEKAVEELKPVMAFYIGGMGSKEVNFHKDVFVRMGYERECEEIQNLFLERNRVAAAAAVPDELIKDIALIGSREQIRDDLAAWKEAGVTMLIVKADSSDKIRDIAEAVLG